MKNFIRKLFGIHDTEDYYSNRFIRETRWTRSVELDVSFYHIAILFYEGFNLLAGVSYQWKTMNPHLIVGFSAFSWEQRPEPEYYEFSEAEWDF